MISSQDVDGERVVCDGAGSGDCRDDDDLDAEAMLGNDADAEVDLAGDAGADADASVDVDAICITRTGIDADNVAEVIADAVEKRRVPSAFTLYRKQPKANSMELDRSAKTG